MVDPDRGRHDRLLEAGGGAEGRRRRVSRARRATRAGHGGRGSRLDVATLNTFIPQTDRIVYVSDTNPISGNAYRKTLGDFYATLSKLDYKWTKWETYPISENAVGFTGWADITTVTLKGVSEHDRAIVSMVFARDSTGAWKRIIAHKSTILPPAPPPPPATRAR